MKLLLLSSVLLIGVVSSTQAQQASASIEGVVRDLNGKPIAKAVVYGYQLDNIYNRITTTTDSNGKFTFKGVTPGGYNIHAYKESEGYADTLFSFFANGNKKAWRGVTVRGSQKVTGIDLTLGPKYAVLKISIRDQFGNPSGASLTFTRMDDPKHPYQRGGDLSGELSLLVPSVPFRVRAEKAGCKPWDSDLIRPQPGQTLSIEARLLPAR